MSVSEVNLGPTGHVMIAGGLNAANSSDSISGLIDLPA